MKVSKMFPNRYAKGGDLNGKDVTLTIDTVRTERARPRPNAPEEQLYVVYFQQTEKGVALCRTLANQIDDAVDGEGDTDNWKGKRVTIYPLPMKVAGENRIAIRAKSATNGDTEPPEEMQE